MSTGLSAVNTADAWLHVLRGNAAGVTFTAPAVQAAKLHVGDPGSAGTAAPSVGDATRKALTFAAPAGGVMALSTAPAVWTNGGTTEILSHISVWNSTTVGDFQYSAPLTATYSWATTNTFTLTALSISLSPIAT